ncbi:MAG: 50S ribosomal protein L25 [Saprospiraceae bacterium]
MQTVQINAQDRVLAKKIDLREMRKAGMVPCVLYSKQENLTFAAPTSELKNLVFSPDFKIAEISLNGKTYRCILKDIQFNPVTDKVIHIDFLRLVKDAPIKVTIPLVAKGTAAGVKSGGKLVQKIRAVKVKTTEQDLVSELFVDISTLELGQTMRIKDIIPSKGIEILNPPATPIISVDIPRSLKTADATAAAAPAAKK